eukprot:CAMPEP_0175148958 /NCGR_PEP_ID=MMETSP0087-20121206/16936_1 /TAXON_ID=136419 /ORGANISM="Unknown Unknown, Strain D1" /LENGTH=242 /DNA_ID=CAMNT_0016434515 /DNA_START=56 /DNA_END=787 /DNA_ORIENTATION=+
MLRYEGELKTWIVEGRNRKLVFDLLSKIQSGELGRAPLDVQNDFNGWAALHYVAAGEVNTGKFDAEMATALVAAGACLDIKSTKPFYHGIDFHGPAGATPQDLAKLNKCEKEFLAAVEAGKNAGKEKTGVSGRKRGVEADTAGEETLKKHKVDAKEQTAGLSKAQAAAKAMFDAYVTQLSKGCPTKTEKCATNPWCRHCPEFKLAKKVESKNGTAVAAKVAVAIIKKNQGKMLCINRPAAKN